VEFQRLSFHAHKKGLVLLDRLAITDIRHYMLSFLNHVCISFYEYSHIFICEILPPQTLKNCPYRVGILRVIETQVDVREIFFCIRDDDYFKPAAIADIRPHMLSFRRHYGIDIGIEYRLAADYFHIEAVNNLS